MKNRKMRLLVGVLVGLVFFSSSLALLFYLKQGNSSKIEKVETIGVYISTRTINRGELIQAKDITEAMLPRSYVSATPLMATEIIGRYATTNIFIKEPLRKEKLSLTQPLEIKSTQEKVYAPQVVEKVENISSYDDNRDTMTVPLYVFKNIDETLKAGDYIDILTIVPKKSDSREFKTKYVALHILINSFISHAAKVDSIVSVNEKNEVSHASSIVFEILPGDIKNFLSSYYKTQELNTKSIYNTARSNGGHLWMVKCTTALDPTIQKFKRKMLIDHVTVYKRRKKATHKVSISYEN